MDRPFDRLPVGGQSACDRFVLGVGPVSGGQTRVYEPHFRGPTRSCLRRAGKAKTVA
ncbi:hypothetical protein AKJ09_10230 [Labilithrix luteola]|uniref:Uncharacterized protein n=1 Tax=Labilithrix luteola TaxID=1391654 RepID=A0A0K1QD27_9BACT|nr:hypothetical protein AKJ09_10230 [Labilithrix luteola]